MCSTNWLNSPTTHASPGSSKVSRAAACSGIPSGASTPLWTTSTRLPNPSSRIHPATASLTATIRVASRRRRPANHRRRRPGGRISRTCHTTGSPDARAAAAPRRCGRQLTWTTSGSKSAKNAWRPRTPGSGTRNRAPRTTCRHRGWRSACTNQQQRTGIDRTSTSAASSSELKPHRPGADTAIWWPRSPSSRARSSRTRSAPVGAEVEARCDNIATFIRSP